MPEWSGCCVSSLKIISGEADVAFVRTSLDDFALYKENEDQGGYRVVLLPGLNGSDIGISLNLNHPEQWRAELYQDLRFRQALSMAINRDEVNEAAFFGLAVPRQTTTLPQNSYYKDEWENVAADYDPTPPTSCWTNSDSPRKIASASGSRRTASRCRS